MNKLRLALLALCHACTGGTDTGNPLSDGPDGSDNAFPPEDCDERPRQLDPDEPTPLGVTGRQVLGLVSGQHRQPLAWQATQTPPVSPLVSYGPESGTGEIVLDVEPTGALRYVERDRSAADLENVPEEDNVNASDCEDVIEVDAMVHVSTAGGALAEPLRLTLRASSADLAHGGAHLDTAALRGALGVEVLQDGLAPVRPAEVELRFFISSQGSVGYMRAEQQLAQADQPDFRQTFSQSLAQFPPAGACDMYSLGVPFDATLRGISLPTALERLNAGGPFPVGPAEAALDPEFTGTAQQACASFDYVRPSRLSLSARGHVGLAAGQAPVDTELYVGSRMGALRNVRATASLESRDPAELEALPARFGIEAPLDFSGYDSGRFELEVSSDPSADTGSLRALGLVDNPCAAEPASASDEPCREGPLRSDVLWGTMWVGDRAP